MDNGNPGLDAEGDRTPTEEFLRGVPDDKIEIELRDAGDNRAGEDAAG